MKLIQDLFIFCLLYINILIVHNITNNQHLQHFDSECLSAWHWFFLQIHSGEHLHSSLQHEQQQQHLPLLFFLVSPSGQTLMQHLQSELHLHCSQFVILIQISYILVD